TPVTLVASSNLGLLPLHAAPVTLDGRTAPFMDFFAVRYAPSATALHAAHQRTQRASTRLLAVGNPEHVTHPAHLTDWLAQEAVRLTPDAALPLLHAAATVAAVENALAAAVPEHLLFGCHGHFNIADPLQSGLALTDGKLTLARLLTSLRLDGVDLATLCACQTAITNFQQAQEEAVGLPAAFLQAGVRRVVGTLWSVEALPTVLLLRRYLTRMAEGASALSALHEAVRWLRTLPRAEALAQIAEVRKMNGDNALAAWYLDSIVATDPRFERQTPFAGPSDWAAFTYTGV
ncbi:MAG: CHAT domain-containing protein, partial [Caldilinea sp.]|nr:CHAT domain-containing protein [Caldilinea sp.]